ncbi:MAG TPA: hypothetical protein VJI15_05355 [Candidatus Nanoarchaeia archaeon]|nr:hypothetical protein [Candidatus Nanoarchaeia archaeon]
MKMGLGHRYALGPALDTRYRFKRAVDCDITELESVLDYFAPGDERTGNWRHNPIPLDPVESYRACYETLRGIDPNTELTTAQYIRRALADKEDGSSAIFELTRTLVKYLTNIDNEGK